MPLNRYERVCLMASNIYVQRLISLEQAHGVRANEMNKEMIMKDAVNESFRLSEMVKDECARKQKEEKNGKNK